MVDVHRATVEVAGAAYEAEASLNNCSGVFTSFLRRDGQIRATGAGYSPEEAIRVAAERLTEALRGGVTAIR